MSKKIRWLEVALNDFEQAVEYIAQHNRTAAGKLADRIWKAVENLVNYPEIGRPGRISGTRELVITGTSYIVPYRFKGNEIQILRVLHGARQWRINIIH